MSTINEILIEKIKQLLVEAKKASETLENDTKEIFAIFTEKTEVSPENICTDDENEDNLGDSIKAWIDHGEYPIEWLLDEIKNAFERCEKNVKL